CVCGCYRSRQSQAHKCSFLRQYFVGSLLCPFCRSVAIIEIMRNLLPAGILLDTVLQLAVLAVRKGVEWLLSVTAFVDIKDKLARATPAGVADVVAVDPLFQKSEKILLERLKRALLARYGQTGF